LKKFRNYQKTLIKTLFILMLIVFISGTTGWMVKAQSGGGEQENQFIEKTHIQSSRFESQDRLRVIVQLNVPDQIQPAELMTPAIRSAQSDLESELKAYNIKVIHEFESIPFVAMEVDQSGFEKLLKSALVVGVEEDKENYLSLQQSVPLIRADQVWSAGYTGAGQVVAVLDSGVDKNHPALSSKVVSEACYSSGYISFCPGGVPESIATNSGLPCSGYYGCDHGTHVAGIVAANGPVVKGVAKDANIIAVQVFSLTSSGGLTAWDSDIAKGLERVYALRNVYNIAAVNLSLGGNTLYSQSCDAVNSTLKTSIDRLRSAGIATIIASGNDGSTAGISSPACISTAVSVGATTKADDVANYSNSAEILDLLAPGSSIYSTLPESSYGYKSGTSMATPHVAGAWALMKSGKPGASVSEILNAFKVTGVPVLDSGNNLTKPRIDVFAAVQSLLKPGLALQYSIFLPLLNKNNQTFIGPIKNGGFEDGQDGSWLEYSNNGYHLILTPDLLLVPPHQGNYAVWLGGENDEISRLSQTFTISSGAPYLHFWYWIGSEDICDFDYFSVKINSNEKFQATLCADNNTLGWVEKVLNLDSYSGSTVNLMFEA
jgi:subtilisin family serine protease